jgi:hypothetical protein
MTFAIYKYVARHDPSRTVRLIQGDRQNRCVADYLHGHEIRVSDTPFFICGRSLSRASVFPREGKDGGFVIGTAVNIDRAVVREKQGIAFLLSCIRETGKPALRHKVMRSGFVGILFHLGFSEPNHYESLSISRNRMFHDKSLAPAQERNPTRSGEPWAEGRKTSDPECLPLWGSEFILAVACASG